MYPLDTRLKETITCIFHYVQSYYTNSTKQHLKAAQFVEDHSISPLPEMFKPDLTILHMAVELFPVFWDQLSPPND